MHRNKQSGFTLIEVLVALTIIAIALAAGVQASSTLINSSDRQRESMLAQVCIENVFIEMRLKNLGGKERLSPGETDFECQQAGINYSVALVTNSTLNPQMLRLEATAKNEAGENLLTLSSVLGPP